MWPLRSMGIRSLFSLTKSQVDWGLDLKPSERYTQGQSFSSNIDEKSTGNPSPRLTSYTKRCTTSSNILYTIFIFGDRGHQVIIHPLKRENFLVPASPPVLPARRCPCPSPSQRGTLSAGGAQGRRRGAGYLGRRSIDLSGALRFLKPNWEKIFQKVKVSLVDVVDCYVYICVSS